MPELPEVETVRRGLEAVILGQLILKVDQRRPDLRMPFPKNFARRLAGQTIRALRRRAKYILMSLDSGDIVVLHLGMSGRILIEQPGYKPQKHDHLIFHVQGHQIVFHDPRRFGMVLLLTENGWEEAPPFNALGPEPLGNDFSGPVLYAALKNKKTPIKSALLDQRVVCGLGNIYVCEALFMAGIHPLRPASTLNQNEADRLAHAIQEVLNKAIQAGGSSLKDYRQTDGELGYFQHQFSVYDREGQGCPSCDCNVDRTGGITRIVQSGRSSFFCARKQG